MSHDVSLLGADGSVVSVDRHADGGTYVIGGTTDAEINITYNYGQHIWPLIDGGIKGLHGKRAGDCIDDLTRAVAALGVERDRDYWAATPGNAGYALSILLRWARQHPDATFDVS